MAYRLDTYRFVSSSAISRYLLLYLTGNHYPLRHPPHISALDFGRLRINFSVPALSLAEAPAVPPDFRIFLRFLAVLTGSLLIYRFYPPGIRNSPLLSVLLASAFYQGLRTALWYSRFYLTREFGFTSSLLRFFVRTGVVISTSPYRPFSQVFWTLGPSEVLTSGIRARTP